jgi:hypothetical protein
MIQGDITALISWINNIRTATKQTGEWDDATEAAWRAGVVAMGKDPAQQPDPPQATA